MTTPHVCSPLCLEHGDTIVPWRHVGRWGLTATEQMGPLARLGEALTQGWTGFDVSRAGGHFHLMLQQVLKPPRLVTGTNDPLLPLLARGIDSASRVDLAVAFVMEFGVRLIEPWMRDLLDRGG